MGEEREATKIHSPSAGKLAADRRAGATDVSGALAALAQRLDPLIRRLSSDHEGERLATVAAIERVLRAHGLDFHDLAGVVGDGIAHRELMTGDTGRIFYCLAHAPLLSDWERGFCGSLLGFRRLSPKQLAHLDRIVARLQEGG